MDNKKWSKRIASVVWWVITILPLIVMLINIIGMSINTHITTLNDYSSIWEYYKAHLFEYSLTSIDLFGNFTFSFLNTLFYNLFDLIGLVGSDYIDYLAMLFGWFTTVQFLHLLFDFIAWVPMFFHKILSKNID